MHCSVFVHSMYRVWSPPVHRMFTECWYCGRQSQIRSCPSGSAREQPFTPYPSLEKRFSWPGSSIWQEQWQALEHHSWMGPCGTTQRLRMTSDLSRQCWPNGLSRQCWPLNTFWPLWTRRVSILHDWFEVWFTCCEHTCTILNMPIAVKHDLNMISCSGTRFHVLEHGVMSIACSRH